MCCLSQKLAPREFFFFLRGTKFTGAPPPPKEEEEEEEALYNIRLHLLSPIPRKNCSFAMGVWEYKSFANSLHFFKKNSYYQNSPFLFFANLGGRRRILFPPSSSFVLVQLTPPSPQSPPEEGRSVGVAALSSAKATKVEEGGCRREQSHASISEKSKGGTQAHAIFKVRKLKRLIV